MLRKKVVGESHRNENSQDNERGFLNEYSNTTEGDRVKKIEAERQRRKIEAYFLGGENSNYIKAHDIEDWIMEYEEDFLQKMANGEITRDKKENLLSHISTPLHNEGDNKRIFDKIIEDPYQQDIFTMVTGKNISDESGAQINDLNNILKEFETPLDFEDTESNILYYAEDKLSKDNFEAFCNSMKDFKHNIYGKREEYYEQLKILEQEAEKTSPKREKEVDKASQRTKRYKPLENQKKLEKHESPKNSCGVAMISKKELNGESNNISEDSYFIDEEKGIYAVFDGVGGNDGGSAASQCASDALRELCKHENIDPESAMKSIHRSILEKRFNREFVGQTTAVIAQIESHPNGKMLNLASIGDSRLYLVRGKQAYQLTRDDNVTEEILDKSGVVDPLERESLLKHGISKCLGDNKPTSSKVCSDGNYGSYRLIKGDRIMICSDGITGDTPEDHMHPEEIQQILEKNHDDKKAAQALVDSAKKTDDRTAIVITV